MRSSPPLAAPRSADRGSALVPMVAAMILLLLCGVALSEVFGSQQRLAGLEVESAEAAWIAEAGLWHAAFLAAAIPSAVPFHGGSYTVAKDGSDYTATASAGNATRVTPLTVLTLTGPLDEAASIATARISGSTSMDIDLVSLSETDVVIEAFELNATGSSVSISSLKLASSLIFNEPSPPPLPVGLTFMNKGTASDATVPAGTSPTLRVGMGGAPTGTVEYLLTLHFSGSTHSTLLFTVAW